MPLINLVVILIVIGVLLWLVNNYIPMDLKIKNILNTDNLRQPTEPAHTWRGGVLPDLLINERQLSDCPNSPQQNRLLTALPASDYAHLFSTISQDFEAARIGSWTRGKATSTAEGFRAAAGLVIAVPHHIAFCFSRRP